MKAKPLLNFLILLILTTGCTTTAEYFQKGNYEMAIEKASRKLARKPDHFESQQLLIAAYNQSILKNQARINALQLKGQADRWEAIHWEYLQMQKRQKKIERKLSVLPDGLVLTDYSAEIESAKQNATAYLYAKGEEAMLSNNRFGAREAYDFYNKTKKYYDNYRDVNEKMTLAKKLGTNHVLYRVENHSGGWMDPNTLRRLQNQGVQDINHQWVKFYTVERPNIEYDHEVILEVTSASANAGSIREFCHFEEKDVIVGYKIIPPDPCDSNSVERHEPIYDEIRVKVVEKTQKKSAFAYGKVKIVNLSTGEVMRTEDVAAADHFKNTWVDAFGNMDALDPGTLGRLGGCRLPFPGDYEMMERAVFNLKHYSKFQVRRHMKLLL